MDCYGRHSPSGSSPEALCLPQPVDHSRSLEAALTTDSTHGLKEKDSPAEYVELAIQEIAFVESEVDIEWYTDKLETVRLQLQESISN